MQSKCQLAPIGVSTYSRINHLKQTIEALQQNTLAKESELYIFSDAPKDGDEELVAKVREYIHTIDGFKKVHIIERETNGRVANNRGGMEALLDKYEKIIFLEEDIVTSAYFLEYMNDALHFYKNDNRISSISGYCPPMKVPVEYEQDIFILHRFAPWGFAIWKDSYEKYFQKIDEETFRNFFASKKFMKQLIGDSGEEVLVGIKLDAQGLLDMGDAKMIFWQNVYKVYTLYPRESLVKNIGQDGSGVHMGITNKWDTEIGRQKNFTFIENIQPDDNIRKLHKKFYSISKRNKLINILNQTGMFKYIYPLYKKFMSLKSNIKKVIV